MGSPTQFKRKHQHVRFQDNLNCLQQSAFVFVRLVTMAVTSLVQNPWLGILSFFISRKAYDFFFSDTVFKKHTEVIRRKHCLESDLDEAEV